MKYILALALLFGPCLALAAPNPAEYTVNIHVVSSNLAYPPGEQVLHAVIDGKKYELGGTPINVSPAHAGLIVPGNYKARLVTSKHKGSYAVEITYEFLFPDGKTMKYDVIGEME